MRRNEDRLITPKLLRIQNGYTQDYVAKEIQLPIETYKAKEQGRSKWWAHEIFALSQFYDVSMDYIFLGEKCHKKTHLG